MQSDRDSDVHVIKHEETSRAIEDEAFEVDKEQVGGRSTRKKSEQDVMMYVLLHSLSTVNKLSVSDFTQREL